MKKPVEINDTLEERLAGAIKKLRSCVLEYLETSDSHEPPCLENDLDDCVHEIVEGLVPINTKEIEDIWHFNRSKLTRAYENSGWDDELGEYEGGGKSAIYCYIKDGLVEWYKANDKKIVAEYVHDNPDKCCGDCY